MKNILYLIFSLVFVSVSNGYEIQDTSDAMAYLGRFGYIGKDTASHMNIIDAGAVLKEFQHMAGINETGILDKDTLQMMNMPRCGNLDLNHEMIPDSSNGDDDNTIRRKRYKLSETRSKWKKRELTYRISKFSDQMSIRKDLIERDVAHAFKIWEGATNLNFIKSDAKHVDIDVGFATAKHHDSFPFDGPGKTLAHAFSPGPGLGGDVHFDDHEKWTVDTPTGTNVLFVAVHEIGHSLGLSHSDQKGAIMQAFYGGYRPQLKLHEDDIAGIQFLYGKRETGQSSYNNPKPASTPPLFTTPPTRRVIYNTISTTPRYNNIPVVTQSVTKLPKKPTYDFGPRFFGPSGGGGGDERSDICLKDTKIDAATTLKDGYIYVFSGKNVFQLDEKSGEVIKGWPKKIEVVFKGIEPNIDAAFTRKNGKTYIFKGGRYWRTTGYELDSGYPKSISKHFPGIPDYVDSAFIHPLNEQIYFTKGVEYWRFDPTAKGRPHVQSFYPLSISLWKLPKSGGLDATLVTSTGNIYFFKGNEYWKFDKNNFKIFEGYPKLLRLHWFGCTKKVYPKN